MFQTYEIEVLYYQGRSYKTESALENIRTDLMIVEH